MRRDVGLNVVLNGWCRSADGLLSKRKAEGDGERFLRMEAAIASRDEPFLLKKSDFGDQYFSVYCQRLETLRPVLSEVAQSRWNDPNVLLRTIDLRPEQSVTLIGTLVKELKLLPTVLQQYTKEVRPHSTLLRLSLTM